MNNTLKIVIQILIGILIMVGLMCLMAHLITVWELNLFESSLFGIFTGVVIVTAEYVVVLLFNEK
jgi:hypothetical protein